MGRSVPGPSRWTACEPRTRELKKQQGEHRDDEHGAERGGRDAVEARLVGDVDFAGEGVEAEDRDGAEVADHEQRDEQRAGGDHRLQLRQHDGAEDLQRAAAHRARRVLQLRVDPPQGGRAAGSAAAGR